MRRARPVAYCLHVLPRTAPGRGGSIVTGRGSVLVIAAVLAVAFGG
jgi:hypothetical protein